MLPNSKLFLL